MANPYAEVIRELEEEMRRIEQAIAVLQQRAPTGNSSEPKKAPPPGSGPLSEESTNDESVDAVMTRRNDLKATQVVKEAANLGKTLNINSVRWTLANGVKEGRYTKRKEENGRANLYSLAK